MVHTLEIQPLPFLLKTSFPILIISLHCLESDLDLMEDLLTVLAILTVIHFTVLLLMLILLSMATIRSRIYSPAVLIITAYSMFSKLSHCTIYVVHTVICYRVYVQIAEFRFELLSNMTVVHDMPAIKQFSA